MVVRLAQLAGAGKRFALLGRAAGVSAAFDRKGPTMISSVRHSRLACAAAVSLAVLAAPAHARNVKLMESVPDTASQTRVHEILGDLVMQFGSASAQGAPIVRRDVVVKGVGETKLRDVNEDKARPSDHDLCARAFEDAVTQFAFAARGAKASAIVGVVSAYEGTTFDDPTHYECHVGALKAAVTLRGQFTTGPVAAPVVVAPPQPPQPVSPAVPVISPPPQPQDASPPPAPTFQPLPPRNN